MLLLDTHALVWLATSDRRMGHQRRRALLADDLAVSAASIFALTQLVRLGRLQLRSTPTEWVAAVLEDLDIQVLPIDRHVALRAGDFAPALRDPIDCLIASSAVIAGCTLVTADERLVSHPAVPTAW